MTDTETALLERFKSPTVPLGAICDEYFGMKVPWAHQQAKMNMLPIPTFRMTDSRKAPRLVKLSDLAAYIDTKSAEARRDWRASQA